jgi:hypothetical protein
VGKSRSKNRSTCLAIHKDIRLIRKEGLAFWAISGRPGGSAPIFLFEQVGSGGEQ